MEQGCVNGLKLEEMAKTCLQKMPKNYYAWFQALPAEIYFGYLALS